MSVESNAVNQRPEPPLERGIVARSRDGLVLLALIGVSLALFLYFLRDPLGQDDRLMAAYARRLLDGARGETFSLTHYRLGFLLDHAFWQLLFGYSATAYYATALFHNVMAVCSVFFLARLFAPRAAAAATALLLATNPYFLSQSSWPQVDWPAAWRFFAGLALAILALRSSAMKLRWRCLCALAAGFLLWWSLFTKLSVAPMFLVLPALVLFVRFDAASWKCAPLILAAFAASAGLGMTMEKAVFGDPVASMRRTFEAQTDEFVQRTYMDKGLMPTDLTWTDLLLRYPRLYAALKPGRALLVASLAAGVVALLSRSRPLLLLLALAAVSWAGTSLAITSADPLIPLLRTKDRYFAPTFGLLIVLTGCAAWVLHGRVASRLPRFARASGVAWMLLAASAAAWQIRYHWFHPIAYSADVRESWAHEGAMRQMRRFVSGTRHGPVRRILADTRSMELVEMFADAPPGVKLRAFDYANQFALVSPVYYRPGDLLYIDAWRLGSNEQKYYGNKVPSFIYDPPPGWRRLWHNGRQSIVYVTDEHDAGSFPPGQPPPRDALLSLLWAYSYEDRPGTIVDTRLEARGARFELRDAGDVRIVLGAQKYAKRPDVSNELSFLQISRPQRLQIRIEVLLEGQVKLGFGRLVLFKRDQRGPALPKLKARKLPDKAVALTGEFSLDPEQGHEIYNILLKCSGSGAMLVRDLRIEEVGDEEPR